MPKRAKLAYCRTGGQQRKEWDYLVSIYFGNLGMLAWRVVAANRGQWKQHEVSFIEFALNHLSSSL